MLICSGNGSRRLSLEHQAFDLAGVGMAYIKGDRFVRVNDAFARLVGYPAKEIEGASFFDFVHADDVAQKRAEFANMLQQGKAQVRFDESYFRRDGSKVWVTLTATRIDSDEADRLIVALDITSRVTAEQQAHSEHEKLRSVLAAMTDGVFFSDLSGNFVDYNHAFAKLYRLDDVTGDARNVDVFDRFEMSGRPLELENWPVVKALRGETGNDQQVVFRRRGSDDEWFCSFNYAPLRNADDETIGGVVVARDVTERVLADRRLQAERDKLKAALFSMPDAVFIGDGTDFAAEFNDAFVSFMRFSDAETTLRRLADYPRILELHSLSGDLVPLNQWPIMRALRGEVGVGEEFKFVRRDTGDWWFASSNYAPIRTPDGSISGTVCIFRDVTAAKLAEDALHASREKLEAMVDERTRGLAEAKLEAERANAAKTRFLAAASHDLRQPMQAAKAYLGMLERLPQGTPNGPIVTGLETSLSVMSGLLGTMLDMSRLQSGIVKPRPTVFPLAGLLDQVVRANMPAADAKGLEMRTELQPCLVSTDHALLLSAVHNLLSNAVKYTEAGFVAVRCAVTDDVATIEIEDSGIGISEENRSAIFQEYVQLANPARNPEHGVGLGLSLVKSSLEILGISLRLDSRVGEGTRFTFDLPCRPIVADDADDRPVAADAPAATTVLVVEDDTAVRESFVGLLQICGNVAHGVATGAEALDFVARGNAFDVMVTDYRLPDGYGTDFIRAVRDVRGSVVPAILITGETQLDDIRAQGIVNCRVMSKPVKVPLVMETLAQLTRPGTAPVRERV